MYGEHLRNWFGLTVYSSRRLEAAQIKSSVRYPMISGSISYKNYLDSLRFHRQRAVKRLMIVLATLAVAGMIGVAAGYSLAGLILVGASIGGVIGEFLEYRFLLPRRANKIYRQQVALRANYIYYWDKEWLSFSSDRAQGKRLWSDYTRILENDELLLLYHSDVMFEIFPKAWFTSPEQANEFRALAIGSDTTTFIG